MRKLAAAVFLLFIIGLMVLCVAPAFAQDASPADVAVFAVSWVCSNQEWAVWLTTLALMHVGFSAISAITKKLGITSDSPIVKFIRLIAMDVKPPASVIVAQADAIRPAPPAQAMSPRPTVIQP